MALHCTTLRCILYSLECVNIFDQNGQNYYSPALKLRTAKTLCMNLSVSGVNRMPAMVVMGLALPL